MSSTFDTVQKDLVRAAMRDIPERASNSPTNPRKPDVEYESYGFVGEESRVHFEFRARRTAHDRTKMRVAIEVCIVVVGVSCAAIAGGMNLAAANIHRGVSSLVEYAMWPTDEAGEEPRRVLAFVVYLCANGAIVLVATQLTCWAPAAALSGLPKLKSFLNGADISGGLLSVRTLLSKLVGTTLVVATGLPLGKEGPMVHIGALVAALTTKLPGAASLPELHLPVAQREWVGMGAAAGVAAAFNAPFSGILYSFEEVCSHWSAVLTWRSFVCAVVVSLTFELLVELADGQLARGFGIYYDTSASYELFDAAAFFWVIVVACVGGVLGGVYNLTVVGLRRRRKAVHRGRWRRVTMTLEAVVVSAVCFSTYFWAPSAFSCEPCPETIGSHHRQLSESSAGSSGSISSSGRGSTCAYGGHEPHVRYDCDDGEHNPLATLMLGGQEGQIIHLLSRQPADAATVFSTKVLTVFLSAYYPLACATFGIHMPSGNFVPGIVIGASSGRLIGELLQQEGLAGEWTPGAFALIGAAAVLSSMTRMSLTLAAILIEVAKDVRLMPATMLSLTVARVVGNLICNSFDEEMMAADSLPFLDESPPEHLAMITARDTMQEDIVTLPEKVKVRALLQLLQKNTHNGFPVVSQSQSPRPPGQGGGPGSPSSPASKGAAPNTKVLRGLILRRQLLVLLSNRVWIYARHEFSLKELQTFVAAGALDGHDPNIDGLEADPEATLDLRPYMDPSPVTVSELMPLSRVYRFFNQLGIRHLPVVDDNHRLVGIITRKDLHVGAMESTLIAHRRAEVKSRLANLFTRASRASQSDTMDPSTDAFKLSVPPSACNTIAPSASPSECAGPRPPTFPRDLAPKKQYQALVQRYSLPNPKLRHSVSDLCAAAVSGDIDELRHLIQDGLSVDQCDYDKRTALHLAASEGLLQEVQVLIDELGANPSVVDRWGGTPLDDAIRSGHGAVAALLQARGGAHGLTEKMGLPALSGDDLCHAASQGDYERVRLLVGQGLCIDQGDYDKRTALHLAASEGLLEEVQHLIDDLGANPSVVDRWGGTPLDDATRSGHEAVVELLNSRGAAHGLTGNLGAHDPAADLCYATVKGDAERVRQIVREGCSIDQGDYDKRTALHLAASEGVLAMVKMLVEELGANPSPRDRWGSTPLDDATGMGHEEVVNFLLAHGATRSNPPNAHEHRDMDGGATTLSARPRPIASEATRWLSC